MFGAVSQQERWEGRLWLTSASMRVLRFTNNLSSEKLDIKATSLSLQNTNRMLEKTRNDTRTSLRRARSVPAGILPSDWLQLLQRGRSPASSRCSFRGGGCSRSFSSRSFILQVVKRPGFCRSCSAPVWPQGDCSPVQGHVVHNWKARWFVLTPDKLLYFKYEGGKRDSSQRGKILLKDCVITCPFLEYENRPLVLKLHSKLGVDHFLEACSREERDAWAADIRAAVDRLQTAEEDEAKPSSAETQLQNVDLSKVLDSMYDVHSGIRMGSHVEQGSTYSNCFSGSAVVDWLVFVRFALTRLEAVTLGSALVEMGHLQPVGLRSVEALRSAGLSQQFLDDSTALYSFAENLKKRGSVKAEKSLSALELSGKVVKRGYLLKQGHRRKNWKVRLFVLRSEPAFLHYFDPCRDDCSPAGGFSLRGCLVSSLEDNGVPSGVKGNVQGNLFKIITQSDVHYFIQAPTQQEKMEWIDAIRQQT